MNAHQAVLLQNPSTIADVPHFLYYVCDVKGIVEKGWDWQLYDEQYRKFQGACA